MKKQKKQGIGYCHINLENWGIHQHYCLENEDIARTLGLIYEPTDLIILGKIIDTTLKKTEFAVVSIKRITFPRRLSEINHEANDLIGSLELIKENKMVEIEISVPPTLFSDIYMGLIADKIEALSIDVREFQCRRAYITSIKLVTNFDHPDAKSKKGKQCKIK